MPLYEYLCENGHRFEKIRKFSDPPIEVCPTCGAPVRKLMSSPAIQFKGSGWYITDYARKDSAAAGKSNDGEGGGKSEKSEKSEKSDSSKESSSSTSSEAKSDTKTKTESKSDTSSKSESKS